MDPAPAELEPQVDRRKARLAGALATALTLAALYVASALIDSLTFPPTAIADAAIRQTPGDVATFFIELLAHWAARLMTFGAVAVALAVGAEALARASARGLRPWIAGSVLGAGAIAAAAVDPMGASVVTMAIAVPGAAALYAISARAIYSDLVTAPAAADPSRRRALRLGVGAAAGLALGGSVVGWVVRRLTGPNRDVTLIEPAVRATVPDRAPFPRIEGLTPEVTSAAEHYVVDINLVRPTVETEGWTLPIRGDVDNPLELDFTSIQERFEVVEEHAVLTCISNEVGGDLVGHSVWGGVRLRDVLDEARVRTGAADVVFRAADGYSDSIPLEVARDPAVLIAISQNGEPLTQAHGFPCRVRIPAIYGMKNMKWLTSIELVDFDYRGYWMDRGWSDVATVRTQSRIDVAGVEESAAVGEETWVAGVAWAGDRGVSKVEVSTDDGRTWSEAELREPISERSWRQWAYRWTPGEARDVNVMCRATDGAGEVQTQDEARPHPAGATGYHSITVSVS